MAFFYNLFEMYSKKKDKDIIYEFFIRSLVYFAEILDNFVCLVKFLIADFINDFKDQLYSKFIVYSKDQKNSSSIIDLIPYVKGVYVNNNETFNFSNLIQEYVLVKNYEPFPFIIALVPYIFDVNIVLYETKQSASSIMNFSCNIDNFPTITLIKNENLRSVTGFGNLGYFPGYSYQDNFTPLNDLFYKSLNYGDLLPDTIDEFQLNLDRNLTNQCFYCNNVKDNYCYRKDDNVLCFDCLNLCVNKIIAKRLSSLEKEYFFNIECKSNFIF